MSVLSKAYMHNEAAAFAHVESILWPNGPVCPHCGVVDSAYKLEGVRTKASKKHPEGKERFGLWKCRGCRKQFTVRKGTIFEESHIEMFKWLQAIHLMVSSKKGISAHQLHRVLEITHKSAWFMAHRIREAMRTDGSFDFGAGGGTVEVDETYIGREPGRAKRNGWGHKMKVLTLVDRNTGQARNFVLDSVNKKTIMPILRDNIAREASIMTDEARWYGDLALEFASHDHVQHGAGEFGRGDIHTNTVEGYYSVFKRGMKGVYQHCSKKHLHRYAAEFEFRYNNRSANGVEDMERGEIALRSVVGKRLTYQRADI
ncbi:IS1595 family transposase [Pseudooceanicola nanhaiensis]|uniref:IS1595 family transposase n=1 Tax=Pseudooceanicola nanhaiensis TaxID=375761 RepID=UPI001CD67023|nr:IS1595 family transposase [Pseudooceanicola nanhaiensis]MCA0921474.1 IS1595 family transposase [Pseudooceanicola nanhaiensis]